jgi:hypothetical protein
MNKINVAFFFMLGQMIGQLQESCVAAISRPLDYAEWIPFANAKNFFDPGEIAKVLPRSAVVAKEILKRVTPIASHPEKQKGVVPDSNLTALSQYLRKFENVLESECREIFTYHVPDVGAYSTTSLIEKAESHLSEQAQQTITEDEIKDYKQAGECLAFGLHTAVGFHAMRSLEAEARRYHMIVTGSPTEVDWTLDPLINGNSGRGQFGLRDQWKKEGARDDSPLVLVMSLLTTITHIYRNPIMHPEMTLDPEQAKQIFNISSIAINAMVSDRVERGRNVGNET